MRFAQSLRDGTPRAVSRERIRRVIAVGNYRRGDQLPTYAEFCEQLGVSLLTVQRAMGDLAKEGLVYRLHGKGCYVGKTPAGGGRQIAQVGLVFNASLNLLVRTPYLNQILDGILTACTAREIDLTILSVRTVKDRVPVSQLSAQVDAMLLLGITHAAYVREFTASHTPVVLVDNVIPEVPVDAVAVDNAKAVRTVFDHLRALGHRRIAYVGGLTTDPFTNALVESSDTVERREAYLSVMAEAGLSDAVRIFEAGLNEQANRDAVAAARASDRPTAFLTYGAPTAMKLCRELMRAGVRVPEDVSVAGVAGAEGDGVLGTLLLAYAKADFKGMGVTAVEALERRARTARHDAKTTVLRVGVELSPGNSLAQLR